MPFPPEEALGLPVDRLALQLLQKLEEGAVALHRYNFQVMTSASYENSGVQDHRRVVEALAEAYDWLSTHGLVSQTLEGEFITRKGRNVLAAADGRALIAAEARLDTDLHPRIAASVQSQFLLGEYELAAFAAMREVEIRVRELAGTVDDDKENLGVRLMTRAFKAGGPLADPSSDGGEQVATMALFQGAIGVFKNPPSHRQVDYADPTIASEVVLFADLLLRMLEERAAELKFC